jgi:syntaxin 16
MATRNHTALYRRYREALRNVRPYAATGPGGGSIELVEAPLLNQGGPRGYNAIVSDDPDATSFRAGMTTMNLPPAWVDISDQVSADMQRAQGKMAELAKAHSRALMPTFDESSGEEHTIELLSREITKLLKKCEQRLQQLSKGAPGSEQDANIRKNVQRSLATDLQALSMDYRKQQKGYLQKLQRQQEGQSVDDGIGMGKKVRQDDDDGFSEGLKVQQMAQLRQTEALSVEREKEITEIVESVTDLAQIMKDLSVLVIDQGTIVDRIDYNITNVATSVEKGVKELVKAEETQKKGGMVMCVMVLIALCAFMLFVYVVKKILGF